MSKLTLQIEHLSIDDRRKVHGVAYAGGVLSYWGDSIAIDLDTLQLNGKQIPLLHNHDRDRCVGYGWLKIDSGKLLVDGEMLDTDHAKEIISAADSGLTWQMSVHVESNRVITRSTGDMVNGVNLSQDTKVFMSGVIREVSFTPTGVDADTQATILSLSLQEAEMSKETPQGTTEVLSAQLSQANEQIAKLSADNTAKDARIAELEKQIADERTSVRLSQLKDLGVEGERAAKLAQADAETYTALIEQLQLSSKQSAALSANYSAGSETAQRKNPLL